MKKVRKGDKMELIDPRQMLTAVVDAAPVCLCVLDSQGRVVMAEGSSFPEIGLLTDAITGTPAETVWDGYDTLTRAMRGALDGDPATATVVAGDRALEARFLPVAGDGGTSHVVAVVSDVTARYAGMVQIPAREEFLQGILDTVVDGIITIDELGLIRDFNPAAAEIFGYHPSEVVGKRVDMLMPEPHRSAHDGYIQRYIETGVGMAVGTRREISGLRKDGTVFPMEVSISELKVGEHRHFTGIVRDITERKEAERALRASEERYALAARGANDGLWDWDLDRNTIYFSQRWKAMLGCEEHDIGNSPDEWLDRIHQEDVARFCADVEAHLQGRTATFKSEYRIRGRSGEILRMLARGVAVRDEQGRPYRMAGSQADITDQKRAEERLIHDALHDALTGLPNRTLLCERLGQALARIRRNPDQKFALAVLNLDRFRVVNESLGHNAGDDLLAAVARRLENRLRPGHTLARLGADNFGILVEDIASPKDARTEVERLNKAISEPFTMHGREVFTSSRIGIVFGTPTYNAADEMVRDAELTMSRVKRDGIARIRVFDKKLHSEAVGIMQTETDLRKAIEQQRLIVYYQPIVALATGRVAGFEALARLDHPQRGIVPPSEFIGVAEETGLIVPLCQKVMSDACAQTAEWQRRFGLEGRLTVSVNLSARNVVDDGLFAMTEGVLAESGLTPKNLRVEITESLMMTNPGLIARVLGRLKSLGVGLALDDFGTGYSSFSHLRRFPLDTLKIDRSFVIRMISEARDQELVRIIIMLAHTLGLDVIAEGVETAAHVEGLLNLRCEYAQGFHYAAPLPADEAEDMLLRQGAG